MTDDVGTGAGSDGRIAALASLNEPVRRRLYRHVVAQEDLVSREAAAGAVGVARSVAAFHLDKLAELGLLTVEYRRPAGRRGPGAGRPAKLYGRAPGEIALSVPERHYDLAATLLAQAVERAAAGTGDVIEAVRVVARRHGRSVGVGGGAVPGGTVPGGTAPGGTARSPLHTLEVVLVAQGYEPRGAGDCITLANCPFHRLAEEHRDLVCTMNHEFLQGVAEGAGLPGSTARLDPAPGRCCVTLVA